MELPKAERNDTSHEARNKLVEGRTTEEEAQPTNTESEDIEAKLLNAQIQLLIQARLN
jgi:hypothetical protein